MKAETTEHGAVFHAYILHHCVFFEEMGNKED
jgi:hypothetical protein